MRKTGLRKDCWQAETALVGYAAFDRAGNYLERWNLQYMRHVVLAARHRPVEQ